MLAEILKTPGALAELPDDLRHPHALRHTCATQLLQHGANVADVRRFLGHASVKTTSIYLASDDTRQEEIVTRRAAAAQRSPPNATASHEAGPGG